MRFLVIFIFLFFSCSDDTQLRNFLPKSTGGIREMVVVYDTIYEKSISLKLIDKIFQKEVAYILQDEPTFNVLYIPKQAFASNRLIKYFRNILYLNQSLKDSIYKRENIFSSPQLAIFINSKKEEEARKIIIKNKDEILNYFIKNDDDYIQSLHKNNKITSANFLKPFSIDLDIPKDYTESLVSDDFVWLTKDIKEGYYNIMIYRDIYDNIKDINFLKKEIIDRRNFWTKKNIHGTLDNTYVRVENNFDLIQTYTKIDNKFAIKTIGMWKMENDFMGGYFVNYAIVDELENIVYFLDGFVYLPNKKKNPSIIELDNILKSFKKI